MIRTEYKQWAADLAARLPECGAFLQSLGDATKDIWFKDFFASMQLEDCLEANKRLHLMGLQTYDHQNIASIVFKLAQEVRYERSESAKALSQQKAAQRKYGDRRGNGGPVAFTAHFTSCMKSCLVEAAELSPEQRPEFIDGFFAEHDNVPDDDEHQPRYVCFRCQDTGYLSVDVQGRTAAVACGHCDLGENRSSQKWKSGRSMPRMQAALTEVA